MWWKRRKVERLLDEVRALALLNRLDSSRTDLTEKETRTCAVRDRKQLELLAEIVRSNSEQTSPMSKPIPSSFARC